MYSAAAAVASCFQSSPIHFLQRCSRQARSVQPYETSCISSRAWAFEDNLSRLARERRHCEPVTPFDELCGTTSTGSAFRLAVVGFRRVGGPAGPVKHCLKRRSTP